MAADTYNKLMEMDAIEFCKYLMGTPIRDIRKMLLKIRKEQDRDTRHACAEAVLNIPYCVETANGGDAISPDDAHDACMNAKAL